LSLLEWLRNIRDIQSSLNRIWTSAKGNGYQQL
jgi:hypothetical protein